MLWGLLEFLWNTYRTLTTFLFALLKNFAHVFCVGPLAIHSLFNCILLTMYVCVAQVGDLFVLLRGMNAFIEGDI